MVDVGASDVSDNSILAHALVNTSTADKTDGYAIKRSGDFVNEYGQLDDDGQQTDGGPNDPNHLMGAFPTLWPFGKGGIETKRAVGVPYINHVRWALQYADR